MVPIKNKQTLLLEHDCYVLVPNGKNTFREVPVNELKNAPIPSQVYARLKGKAKRIYAVNIEKSGNNNSLKQIVSLKHANHFRARGYDISEDNSLDCLSMETLHNSAHEILFG